MTINKEIQQNVDTVLHKLGLKNPVLLGKGGEGWVYEYGKDALKIYPRNADIEYLRNTQKFQTELAKNQFTFATPQIYDIGEVGGVSYTVEKRLGGIQMDKKVICMKTADRQKLYQSYYQAIRQVNEVTFPNLPYGQIISTQNSITADRWVDFLGQVFEQKIAKTQERMRSSVTDFDLKVDVFKHLIRQHLQSDQKQLVHCDYFLNNVLVDDELKVSAVLDFSVHAAVGDPKLDIAGVLTWNEIDPNIKPEDYMFLYEQARQDYGKDIDTYADLYLLFSSFYFGDMDDPSFSIKQLNNEKLWNKYR